MSENTDIPLKSPLQMSLILILLYYIFLISSSFIFRLLFESKSYFLFTLGNFLFIFCSLAILWLIIVPYGIYLPKDQKSIKIYLNEIKLGEKSFKPLKLIALISIGWIGLIFIVSATVSYITKGFLFNIDFLCEYPMPGKPAYFIFILALIPAIWEEIAFRGVILNYFERNYKEETTIIIYNGVLFGLFHLGNLILGASLFYTIGQVIYSMLIGMYLAFMLVKTKRLYFCILTHYILDVLYFLFIHYF
jgi:membrane protease YdiL (CAAX protease family)